MKKRILISLIALTFVSTFASTGKGFHEYGERIEQTPGANFHLEEMSVGTAVKMDQKKYSIHESESQSEGASTIIKSCITPKDILSGVSNDPENLKQGVRGGSLHPLQKYDVVIQFKNPNFEALNNDENVNLQNSQIITTIMHLKLIEYNNQTKTYKFNLEFDSDFYLIKNRNIGKDLNKKISVKAYFTDLSKPLIQLTGKFIDAPGNNLPLKPINDSSPFILTIGYLNEIGLYPTRDIPITIEIQE